MVLTTTRTLVSLVNLKIFMRYVKEESDHAATLINFALPDVYFHVSIQNSLTWRENFPINIIRIKFKLEKTV